MAKRIEEGVKNHIIKMKEQDKATIKEIIQIVRNTYGGLELSSSTIYNIINPRGSAAMKEDTRPAKRKYKKKDKLPLLPKISTDQDSFALVSQIKGLIDKLNSTHISNLVEIRDQLSKMVGE